MPVSTVLPKLFTIFYFFWCIFLCTRVIKSFFVRLVFEKIFRIMECYLKFCLLRYQSSSIHYSFHCCTQVSFKGKSLGRSPSRWTRSGLIWVRPIWPNHVFQSLETFFDMQVLSFCFPSPLAPVSERFCY